MVYFPKEYASAVERFRSTISDQNPQAGRWNVGSGLDVDHAYWPALKSPERLYILISGTHGPETYTGHAIQMMFLNEIWPKLDRDKCGLFMVHALNPYGFKFNKRCTEAGVNLNRNCSIFPDLYEIENPGSIKMGEKFIPRSPLASDVSPLLQSMRRQGEKIWFDDVDLDSFIKTVAMGQFESAEGLEFGGHKPEPQIRALATRLQEIMPKYREVAYFDLHTGLGHRGRLHLLEGDKKGSVDPKFFHEILDPARDIDIYEHTPNDVEGFYQTYGSTNDMMAELCGPGQKMCALTMEFGTIGHDMPALLESLNLWLAEHQGTFWGYATPEIEKSVRAKHLEKFCPSAEDWRQSVLGASREMFKRILERSRHFRS